MKGSTFSSTRILLKLVRAQRRVWEIFGVVKFSARAAQRSQDRKAFDAEMSNPTLFPMPPLLMLLAADSHMTSARHAAGTLLLPEVV